MDFTNLINAIASDDKEAASNEFTAIADAKRTEHIDAMRIELAQQVFDAAGSVEQE